MIYVRFSLTPGSFTTWRKLQETGYLRVTTRTLWVQLKMSFYVWYVICRLRNLFKQDAATGFVKNASRNILEGAALFTPGGYLGYNVIYFNIWMAFRKA